MSAESVVLVRGVEEPVVRHGAVRRFLRKPLAVGAAAVLLLIIGAVLCANVISPAGPLQQDLAQPLAGPSRAHLLGTDELGRDLLSRLLYGGRPALAAVAVAVLVFLASGVILGTLAGYLGGWADKVISAITDALMSIPAIVIVLAVLAIFNQRITVAMAVFGLLSSATLVRVIRARCLSVREEEFVAAAKTFGLSDLRIMLRHITPGLLGPAIVQLSLFAGAALSVQTGLGFLGLGSLPPAPSWGGMVSEAAQVLGQSSWMLVVTGGVIAVMIVAFGLFGDGVRDATAEVRKSGARLSTQRYAGPAAAAQPSPEAPNAVLEVRDYSIGFTGAGEEMREVVSNVGLTISRGEIVALVGESGSGKTVTALSLLGLLPDNARVLGGQAWLSGEPIASLDEAGYARIRGRHIGLVSQEPMVALDPMFTIGTQLGEALRYAADVPKARLREESLALLRQVRLPDPEQVLRLYPHQLSGGMAQRALIAIALAGHPQLLIADEPTTALDVTVQAEILDLLRRLSRELDMAVLLVTHDLAVVADLASAVAVMTRGRIVESGPVEQIFAQPKDPYTRNLLGSTPTIFQGAS
jgi:peptide/nickel transport system permease protein